MSTEKQNARIEEWEFETDVQGGLWLRGKVYGHPKFEDGKILRTSYVKKVETLNTSYELGEPYVLTRSREAIQVTPK